MELQLSARAKTNPLTTLSSTQLSPPSKQQSVASTSYSSLNSGLCLTWSFLQPPAILWISNCRHCNSIWGMWTEWNESNLTCLWAGMWRWTTTATAWRSPNPTPTTPAGARPKWGRTSYPSVQSLPTPRHPLTTSWLFSKSSKLTRITKVNLNSKSWSREKLRMRTYLLQATGFRRY